MSRRSIPCGQVWNKQAVPDHQIAALGVTQVAGKILVSPRPASNRHHRKVMRGRLLENM